MTELADTQEALLLKLKQKGPQTAKVLAGMLGITTMGVRQHLGHLVERGYVAEGPEQKQGRGRPVKPWKLTQKGHARFPDAHSQVSVELIAAVRDTFGEEALDQLIDSRNRDAFAQYREAVDSVQGLPDKVAQLASMRSREGYMAEVEQLDDQTWLLIENHCPICAAAEACQGFCRSELAMFQQLFAGVARVERGEHLLRGARRCTYYIHASQ